MSHTELTLQESATESISRSSSQSSLQSDAWQQVSCTHMQLLFQLLVHSTCNLHIFASNSCHQIKAVPCCRLEKLTSQKRKTSQIFRGSASTVAPQDLSSLALFLAVEFMAWWSGEGTALAEITWQVVQFGFALWDSSSELQSQMLCVPLSRSASTYRSVRTLD